MDITLAVSYSHDVSVDLCELRFDIGANSHVNNIDYMSHLSVFVQGYGVLGVRIWHKR